MDRKISQKKKKKGRPNHKHLQLISDWNLLVLSTLSQQSTYPTAFEKNKFHVKNSRNKPKHHVIQRVSALEQNKMLMYFPCKMIGKKYNTVMWVQSSWTVTVAQHCCIPIGRIKFWWGKRPPRKWSPPQWQTKDTVLDYRIPGCYQKNSNQQKEKFLISKTCSKNVDKYTRCS